MANRSIWQGAAAGLLCAVRAQPEAQTSLKLSRNTELPNWGHLSTVRTHTGMQVYHCYCRRHCSGHSNHLRHCQTCLHTVNTKVTSTCKRVEFSQVPSPCRPLVLLRV